MTRTDWAFEHLITIRCLRLNNSPPSRPSPLALLAKAKMTEMKTQNELKSKVFPSDDF